MSAAESVALYNALFYVFLGITVLGLGLGVFFFFFFDIPTLRAMMTGKAKEATIRQIEEKNKKTGNLRFQYPGNTGDLGKHGHTGRMGRSSRLSHSGRLGQSGRTGNMERVQPPQTVPVPEATERPETSVLTRSAPETSVLTSAAPETAVLTPQPSAVPAEEVGQTEPLRAVRSDFRFEITQNIIVIHTDELI